ncbi:phosphatidylinositol-binding protein scs2 [Actinomortierella ambigua]|uniref:Phosphatidylinositol-binding protein scs2 n=1 Tax=Actinomortierella ambigua TaxID=1343610 RepID=A0A9P6QJY7_9FUNG|nr:phosphatidylinositol-binding protein scs2 [Actinomortierella ambigua]KAG0267279.1 phosphatidylinositol-binding protein scs2 [Actinomortierella ambigua]
MSIEIDPSAQLAFRRPLTGVIKQTLSIRNTSQLPIAFKVKTTAPKQYCVRPNSGRVGPGQTLEVQVQMQAMKEDPPIDFKCKDKFLVQSVAITAEREQLASADLWPTVERDAKDQIREKKIRCVYLPPLEHEIGQIKEEEDEQQPQHPPSYSTSSFSSVTRVETAPEPVDEPAAVVPSLPSPIGAPVAGVSNVSNEAVVVLKHELEQAKDIIQNLRASNEKLQQEANSLRQRRTEPISAASTAPTMTAVQVKQPQGYPASYVAAAAFIAFIFAWLFF